MSGKGKGKGKRGPGRPPNVVHPPMDPEGVVSEPTAKALEVAGGDLKFEAQWYVPKTLTILKKVFGAYKAKSVRVIAREDQLVFNYEDVNLIWEGDKLLRYYRVPGEDFAFTLSADQLSLFEALAIHNCTVAHFIYDGNTLDVYDHSDSTGVEYETHLPTQRCSADVDYSLEAPTPLEAPLRMAMPMKMLDTVVKCVKASGAAASTFSVEAQALAGAGDDEDEDEDPALGRCELDLHFGEDSLDSGICLTKARDVRARLADGCECYTKKLPVQPLATINTNWKQPAVTLYCPADDGPLVVRGETMDEEDSKAIPMVLHVLIDLTRYNAV